MDDLRVLEGGRIDEAAEASLSAALVPTLAVVAPTVFLAGVLWNWIDVPAARAASATLIGGGVLLGAMALRWRNHPPASSSLRSCGIQTRSTLR